jgi:hypothetical protein
MAAYKRSNPAQLQKDREAIAKDQESRGPGIFERIVNDVKYKIAVRKGRRAGYGAAPGKAGALVQGFKPGDNTT